MVATVTTQKIADGPGVVVVKVTILGDAAGDIVAGGNVFVADPTTFTPATTRVRIDRVQGMLAGFAATLWFDATSDVMILAMPDGKDFDMDYREAGGLSPTGAAGQTGKIQLTTLGLATGETGSFTMYMTKKP